MRQHFIHDSSFVSSPKLLSAILRMWVIHYTELAYEVCEYKTAVWEFEGPLDAEWAIERINSGDCGTTALAVYQVYTELMKPHLREEERLSPLELIDNYNHAYLKLDGRFYDTLNLDGQDDETQMFESGAPNAKVEALTTAELFRRYIWKDRIGAELIRRFCQRFYVEPLAESLALLNEETQLHPTTAAWLVWVDNQMNLVLEPFRPKPSDPIDVNAMSTLLGEVMKAAVTGESCSASKAMLSEADLGDVSEKWQQEMGNR